MAQRGSRILRFDTSYNQSFLGSTLQLHEPTERSKLGGASTRAPVNAVIECRRGKGWTMGKRLTLLVGVGATLSTGNDFTAGLRPKVFAMRRFWQAYLSRRSRVC